MDNACDWREEESRSRPKAKELQYNPTNPNTLLLTKCSYLMYNE